MSESIQEQYLNRYKELHKEKTGEELNNQAVLEHFNKLITLARNIYKPILSSKKAEFELLLTEHD